MRKPSGTGWICWSFLSCWASGGVALNQRAKRREERAEERAKERTLLLKFYDDFFQAYNTAKGIRRLLKAKSDYKYSNESLRIDTASYNEQMGLLIDVQLQFEFLKDQVEVNDNLYSKVDAVSKTSEQPSLRDNLEKIESYLEAPPVGDCSGSARRSAVPSVSCPTPPDQPAHDDDYRREGEPEIDD